MITCLQKLIRYLYSLYFCFAYLNTLLTIGTFNFVMTGYHVSFCTCIFSNDLLKSFLNYREFTSIALYYGSICIHFAVYQMLFICMNSVFNCLCTALCKLCLWIKAKLYVFVHLQSVTVSLFTSHWVVQIKYGIFMVDTFSKSSPKSISPKRFAVILPCWLVRCESCDVLMCVHTRSVGHQPTSLR